MLNIWRQCSAATATKTYTIPSYFISSNYSCIVALQPKIETVQTSNTQRENCFIFRGALRVLSV